MTKKISFHDHEVVGAKITRGILDRADLAPQVKDLTVKLVRHHQFRFYDDTKDSTIKKWMRTLGKDGWRLVLMVRLLDRKGNQKNKDKPLVTQEWTGLLEKCKKLEKNMVYYEDLALSPERIFAIVPHDKRKEALSNLVSIMENDREKNTTKYIKSYLKTNYGAKS